MDEIITLKSGRQLDPNCGFIGCFKDDSGNWMLSDGYDSKIWLYDWSEVINEDTPKFTKEELVELAEIMMSRWQEFRFDVLNGDVPTKD